MRVHNPWRLIMLVLAGALLVPVGNGGLYGGGEALAQAKSGARPLFPSEDFTCYVINQGIAHKETVTLADQFDRAQGRTQGREVVVREPQLLCAPTAKTRAGGDTPTVDEQGPHLKCYKITPAGPPVGETHHVCDQFHDCVPPDQGEQVKVQTPHLLCTLACKDPAQDPRECVEVGTPPPIDKGGPGSACTIAADCDPGLTCSNGVCQIQTR